MLTEIMYMLLTVKNLGGSRMLHTVRGVRILEPGQSITAEFADAQASEYRKEPDLEIADEAGKPASDEPETVSLADRAAALGIEVDKRWGENRLRKEIEKAARR